MSRMHSMLAVPLWVAFCLVLSGCPGKDYMPVYFPQTEGAPTSPSTNAPEKPVQQCTIRFHASLCVAIKGENISVGNVNDHEEPLCTEIHTPISIRLAGTSATLPGELFPDIVIEGHGLPNPITINGRGDTDGRANVGTGKLGADGSLTIDKFSLYITAQDHVGRIPDLSFTTGKPTAITGMAAVSGKPISSDGQLALATSTTLGQLFPSADRHLLGAGLTAVFSGMIEPTLDACAGAAHGPVNLTVAKLILDSQGHEIAVPIPGGNRLEISAGTFISHNATDIGPRFEAHAKFRVTNTSKKPVTLGIPPRVGPFAIASTADLNQLLPPKGELIIHVAFHPVSNLIDAPGDVTKTVAFGDDEFVLTGVALPAEGRVALDSLDATGNLVREKIDTLTVGDVYVPASPVRGYVTCATLMCGGTPLPTSCAACTAPDAAQCQLLALGNHGHPLDEVTAQCAPVDPGAFEQPVINFARDAGAPIEGASQVIALRNMGPAPVVIANIQLQEAAQSASTGQFIFSPTAVFVANSPAEIKDRLANALASAAGGDNVSATPPTTALPITLPPYDPPLRTTRAFIVLGYLPNDLAGTDGKLAGIGTTVIDRATLVVTTDHDTTPLQLRGTTTIKDVPALQVFFNTTTGLKNRPDGTTFAFRGITADTTNLAVPLFIRLGESATHPVRITGLRMSGPDAAAFELLQTREQIEAKPDTVRCSSPHFGADGGVVRIDTTLDPVSLAPIGYDVLPGGSTQDTMPLFACVNFHRPETASKQRQFQATLTISAQQIGADKKPLRNADGSVKQSEFQIPLLAVVSPLQGPMVFRLTQTMSSIVNPQFPSINSIASAAELRAMQATGTANASDAFLYLGAFILDPFDETTITSENGDVLTTPGDNITAIFRAIDTRPLPTLYDDPLLSDYSNLAFDATAPKGQQGSFFDFPQLPATFKANSLRIFTTALSYPGPLVPPEQKPQQPSQCEVVDPCSPDGQRKFGDGPTEPGKLGVCAFFYATGADYNSPAFHTAEEMPGGDRHDQCTERTKPQSLKDVTGTYSLDGHFAFDIGLRFWGPTYFHNPNGPLGPVPPLDEMWHINMTTHVLHPPANDREPNLLPSTRINLAKQEFKINLNDAKLETPQICPKSTGNLLIQGAHYSSWRYFAPLMSKDEEGLIPAGCPEPDNQFTGGSAYLHGRPVDHETGIFTVVGAAKFSSNDDLTFAFKDVMIFIVMNGWLCDPNGSPDQFEGARCYDLTVNERDARADISAMGAPQ